MKSLADLSHIVESLQDGGEILVLDTGATIGSESAAMLGALHSRSNGGIQGHLLVLEKKGSENFMGTFYVGYGHQSIGDMGDAQVFIEGVSMLAAKAIQDFPLYNGQEVSTRYVDFSAQRFIDPAGSTESTSMLEELRAFYLATLEEMIPVLKKRFPRAEDESEAKYDKAIKARAFDTTRCLLPAGASTNVAWYGTLRQFRDRLPVLRHHPLAEVRNIAEAAENALIRAYPNSFDKEKKRYPATEEYMDLCGSLYTYFDDPAPVDFEVSDDSIRRDRLAEYREALEARPQKTELPYATRDSGTLEFRFLLDFGSFRDLQRQRSVSMRMPLLTTRHGFEPWYLNEMPEELRARTSAFLAAYEKRLAGLALSAEEAQYYIPMGYRTTIRMAGDLRAHVYVVELRAGVTVHPTLRIRSIQMAKELENRFGPEGLVLHYDSEPDRFDIKRGDHDIVSK